VGLIVDTSALVEMERALAERRTLALADDEILALPAIVWAEALVGVRLADTPALAARRRARLETLRAWMEPEPFTTATAEHYADIFADLSASGTLIPSNDMIVAATARQLGFGVLVGPRDEAHFRRVANLQIHVLA
jgi:predicted nucleic acid-binding protein